MTYAQTVTVTNASIRKADFDYFKTMRNASAKLRDKVREHAGLDPFPVPPPRFVPRPKIIRTAPVVVAPAENAPTSMPTSAQRIVNEIAAAMMLDADEIYSRSRMKPIVLARHLVMTVLYRRGASYSRVGTWLGCDHSTVINGVRRFEERATPYMREIAAKYAPETKGESE